jgi:ferritin-like protein
VPGVRTRRELLGAGAAGAAGLLALPAAAGAATSSATGTSRTGQPPFSESDRLQRLIRLELLLLYCYRSVLGSSILGPRAHQRLAPFQAHEQAHIDALTTHLRARGGAVPPGPDSHRTANRYLARRGVGGRLGQLRGERDALYLLLTLEQVTIGAYFVALTKLKDTAVISLVCEIMANEAQHDAMIGLSLPKATPGSAVPYGMVQGLQ